MATTSLHDIERAPKLTCSTVLYLTAKNETTITHTGCCPRPLFWCSLQTYTLHRTHWHVACCAPRVPGGPRILDGSTPSEAPCHPGPCGTPEQYHK